MNKKLQVFVSSTYTDLIEERQAAVEAILDAGHIPAGMELFKAGNESQLKTIYKWIDESDVYMLILGGRYGTIEKKSNKSYSQLEYEYALSKNIPVFAVVLSKSFLTKKITDLGLDKAIEQTSPNKYNSFKLLVRSKIIREVDDCKDIKLVIHTTLNNIAKEYNLSGWVKNIPNNSLYSLKSDPSQNFDKIIVGAKRITIIARNMANIYNIYQNELEDSIKSGCLYRVLVLDYNEETKRILCDKFPDYGKHSYQNHIATHENLKKLQKKYSNFEYKSTNNVLDYSIALIEYEQNTKNFVQILLYTRTMIGGQRPLFKVVYNNEWYNRFINEIDDLWEDANNFIYN